MTPWAQALQDYWGGPSISPDAQRRWFAKLKAEHPQLTEPGLAGIIEARSRQPRETFAKPALKDLAAWVKAHYGRADKERECYERDMRHFLEMADGIDELMERPIAQIKAVLGEGGYADFERRRKQRKEQHEKG
jgi:hypothetical protein